MKRTPRSPLVIPAVALLSAGLLVAAVGCQPTKKPKTDDAAMAQTPPTPPMNLRAGLPPEAQPVGQESENVSYQADKAGRLYLYDRNANKIVNTFQVEKGQTLLVSGDEGRATLNGNEVALNQIMKGRIYALYFLETPNMSGNNADNGNTFKITPAGQ